MMCFFKSDFTYLKYIDVLLIKPFTGLCDWNEPQVCDSKTRGVVVQISKTGYSQTRFGAMENKAYEIYGYRYIKEYLGICLN